MGLLERAKEAQLADVKAALQKASQQEAMQKNVEEAAKNAVAVPYSKTVELFTQAIHELDHADFQAQIVEGVHENGVVVLKLVIQSPGQRGAEELGHFKCEINRNQQVGVTADISKPSSARKPGERKYGQLGYLAADKEVRMLEDWLVDFLKDII